MNVSIENIVYVTFIATQTSKNISPAFTSLPSNPIDNQLIINNIISFKPSEPTGTTTKYQPGLALLTAKQKLTNLQQKIGDRTIYSKAIDKKKWTSQIGK